MIKIGGSCLNYPLLLEQECKNLSEIKKAVLVPGGGFFADTVREQTRIFKIENTEAHWMAVLAMNQFGYLLHRMVKNSRLCEDIGDIKTARVTTPVIWLPYLEMKKIDPLPHSWNVTSDSIAAWLTVQLENNYFVKVTAFKGKLPSVTVTGDPLLHQTGLTDSYLPEYQDKFKLECHVLCLDTVSSHGDYYGGNRPPDMIIKPRKKDRME